MFHFIVIFSIGLAIRPLQLKIAKKNRPLHTDPSPLGLAIGDDYLGVPVRTILKGPEKIQPRMAVTYVSTGISNRTSG